MASFAIRTRAPSSLSDAFTFLKASLNTRVAVPSPFIVNFSERSSSSKVPFPLKSTHPYNVASSAPPVCASTDKVKSPEFVRSNTKIPFVFPLRSAGKIWSMPSSAEPSASSPFQFVRFTFSSTSGRVSPRYGCFTSSPVTLCTWLILCVAFP